MTDLRKGITVYCSSSDDIPHVYFETARRLGQLIAKAGVPVVNGAGKMGLMAAVTDGALAAGGEAIGVIPGFMVEAGRNHPGLTHTIVTADMHERKRHMAALALGVIALPGGVGTWEELTEMMTARKLGLYSGPVVILNTNGYYDPLLEMLSKARSEGFSYGPESYEVAGSPEEAMAIVTQHLK